MTYYQRAYHGANLLDVKFPQWYLKIDVEDIDIRSWNRCILGQLFGSYGCGLRKLGLFREGAPAYGFSLTNVEFDVSPRNVGEISNPLQAAWVDEIAKRKLNQK